MNKQTKNSRGRPKGSPNRATADVRAAIAVFAQGNVGKLEEWINRVADGFDDTKPDPGKAADLYLKAIEYHIPKLARQEHVGDGGGAIKFELSAPWLEKVAEKRGLV